MLRLSHSVLSFGFGVKGRGNCDATWLRLSFFERIDLFVDSFEHVFIYHLEVLVIECVHPLLHLHYPLILLFPGSRNGYSQAAIGTGIGNSAQEVLLF